MTVTYNLNIPDAPNNPSTDQPNMKTNTNSINTILGVDHVSFNSQGPIGPPNGGGGQHLQVTFNGNNVPTVPTAPPVLFTNAIGSLTGLFYYSGDSTLTTNQYSVANIPTDGVTTCSTYLFGNIIIKCKQVTASDNVTINFDEPFPNNCFGVQLTVIGKTSPATLVSLGGSLKEHFTPRVYNSSGTPVAPVSIFYLAIGN